MAEHINTYGNDIFRKLKNEKYYYDYDNETTLIKLVELFSDINALHPFREENGRTQRIFIETLAKINGIRLDLTNVSRLDIIKSSHEVKVDDGYIAVGSVLMDEKSKEDNLTEAVIVKYDNDFNIVWRKNLNILDTSKFNKVKVDKDGNYVVVGTSVYAPI